jgi:hypothetical protein
MTSFDHKICRPNRTYELRVEKSDGSRVVASGTEYHKVKIVGKRMAGNLNKGESLVITSSDGYEICRWI